MPDSTLDALTAATAATGGLYYGTQGGSDRKFTVTAAGATLVEAANAAAQRTALAVLPLTGGTITGQLINSTNGAASTPPVLLSGTIFTGGSATTTKPQHLIEPAGTTSNNWSTAGTIYGGNAPSGFTGHLLDLQVAAGSKFRVSSTGLITLNNSVSIGNGAAATLSLDLYYNGGRRAVFAQPTSASSGLHFYFEDVIGWTGGAALAGGAADDLVMSRSAAASLQLGANHATTATNQTLKAHNVTTGTGADLILAGGTGSVASGNVRFGTHSGIGAETVTGFITIKDEAGNVRKLAVVS